MEPSIAGRFNYQSFRKGFYNLIYVPFKESVQIVIARNLTLEEARSLHAELNNALNKLREDFYEEEEIPEGERE